ncbi:hypothetical protein E2C01_064206 [Portunus trituberculatus]|uniref:Uncharacterized protein n=1 Tax=Portunus trituberculatus TaxID=210409 RepID=A0A5B7HIG1_PORTR|nr:hypothetical protein [Portunus trituberculatus]
MTRLAAALHSTYFLSHYSSCLLFCTLPTHSLIHLHHQDYNNPAALATLTLTTHHTPLVTCNLPIPTSATPT